MKTRILMLMTILLLLVCIPSFSSRAGVPAPSAIVISSQEHGLGREYQVSSPHDPEIDRYMPASAWDSFYDRTLVVWNQHHGDSFTIEGRLLDHTGKPIGGGSSVLVDGITPVYQPAVVYNQETQQFLLAWMANINMDGKTYSIRAKLLNANLTDASAEFLVDHPAVNTSDWSPRLAVNPYDHGYMVAWNTYNIYYYPTRYPLCISDVTYTSGGGFINYRQVMDTTEYLTAQPYDVDLAPASVDGSGKFMAVWNEYNPEVPVQYIVACYVDALTGGCEGLPFALSNNGVQVAYPRIASTAANHFMVVWQQRPTTADDWDIYGRETNELGTFSGGMHVVAGYGDTDETHPFITTWHGTYRYIVGYEHPSATGSEIWLSYNNDYRNTIDSAGYTFWIDAFPAAAYSFWQNTYPTGIAAGSHVVFAYLGKSTDPGEHTQVYARTWAPYIAFLPKIIK